jgi:hypothetical protein
MKYTKLIFRYFILIVTAFLSASCEWSQQENTQLTIGFGNNERSLVVSRSSLTRAAINDVYPTLERILLSITTSSLSTSDINEQYNSSSFTLTEDRLAIELSDTLVELNVPNSQTLTIEIRAINNDGYQVFRGVVELTPESLDEPSVAVAVPMEVDIDDAIPVLSSLSECDDSDMDDLCDVYEDLFLNAAGVADVDGDGVLNKNDNDADGDSVPDDYDRNSNLTSGNLPTASNDGYPMFIVANRVPVINDVSITTSENQPFTIALPVSEVDADVNDDIYYSMTSEPQNGETIISGTNIIYTPEAFFTGADSFSIQAADIASSYTEGYVDFTVSINVVDSPSLVNTAPVAVDDATVLATPGAMLRLDVLSNDSDADITAGTNDEISISAITTDRGHAFASPNGNEIYFWSDREESGNATITYTIEDSAGAEASAQVIVNLDNVDFDGDGLAPGEVDHVQPINGTVIFDTDDSTADVDNDGFSDWHAAFNADSAGTSVTSSILADTVWTVEGSPYYIPDSSALIVGNDAHLIIEQGVVVKFGTDARLDVNTGGSVSVIGGDSFALSVVFTSDKDTVFQSSLYGQVGLLETQPTAGDWKGMYLSSSESSFIANAAVYFGETGLEVSAGDHKVVNSLFSNSVGAGISYTGESTSEFLSNNVSHNAMGLEIWNAGNGLRFNHTYITNNSGGNSSGNGAGIFVGSDLSNGVTIENSFIFNNSALTGGSAAWIESGSKVSIYGSTFYDNFSGGSGDQNGIMINSAAADQGLVSIRDSLFEDNSGEGTDDVSLTSVAIGNGAVLSNVLSSLTDYNWTDLGGGSGLLTGLNNVFGNFSDAIELNTGGYLQSASPALNIGSVSDYTELTYLTEISNPTTNLAGTVDTSGADQLDAGFHHDKAQFVVSGNDSQNSPVSFNINETEWSPFIAYVKAAGGVQGDSFNQVDVVINPFNGAVEIKNERYLPGGNYAFDVSLSSGQCTSPDFSVSVNGVSAGASTGTLDDTGGC